MAKWSVVLGVLGVVTTAIVAAGLARDPARGGPIRFWLLGIAGLLPAWLVAFLALLAMAPLEGRPELSQSVPWIVSSSAALLGLILTDALARRLRESGQDHSPTTYWLVGLLTFLPAWGVALLGLLVSAPRP